MLIILTHLTFEHERKQIARLRRQAEAFLPPHWFLDINQIEDSLDCYPTPNIKPDGAIWSMRDLRYIADKWTLCADYQLLRIDPDTEILDFYPHLPESGCAGQIEIIGQSLSWNQAFQLIDKKTVDLFLEKAIWQDWKELQQDRWWGREANRLGVKVQPLPRCDLRADSQIGLAIYHPAKRHIVA